MTLLDLIKQFEGCKLTAYKCPAGKWTIGWGSTFYMDGTPVREGDKITQADADIMLQKIVDDFRLQVVRIVPGTLPAGAVDALTSFSYNCGTAALQRSTLLKRIKENPLNLKDIEAEFAKWNKGGGKILAGLVRRRAMEYKMYADAVLNQYTRYELLYKEPPKRK